MSTEQKPSSGWSKGWAASLLTNLEDSKIRTGSAENVVPLTTLSKLHDQARRARSNLVAIHAECHALMMREEEARDVLRRAQTAVIEAIGEIGIKGEIIEPSHAG